MKRFMSIFYVRPGVLFWPCGAEHPVFCHSVFVRDRFHEVGHIKLLVILALSPQVPQALHHGGQPTSATLAIKRLAPCRSVAAAATA